MEKPHIARLYGYSVCLIAVVTFLISIHSFVNAVFDLSNPRYAMGGIFPGSHLESFAMYKRHIQMTEAWPRRPMPAPQESSTASAVPDDDTLRTMYEAAKAESLASARFQAYRSLTQSGLVITVCLLLFVAHWLWLRKLEDTADRSA